MDYENLSVQIIGGAEWITPELAHWLYTSGIPAKNILYTAHDARSQSAAYNRAIQNALAIGSRRAYHLFIDRDMRPKTTQIAPLFAVPYDVSCVRYPTERGEASWAEPTAFHTGMWLISAANLGRLPDPPWFGWVYNREHSQVIGCQCQYFARHVTNIGMTIGHAGYCDHIPRSPATRPEVCFHPKPLTKLAKAGKIKA
jgi:hypothetical protein